MIKKKKILIGAVDVGWRIDSYKKLIEKELRNTHEVISYSKFKLPEAHYKTDFDFAFQQADKSKFGSYLLSFVYFIKFLFIVDIFHFISGETLLTRKLRLFEFFILKLFTKKIIMHVVGTDIRSVESILWKEKNIFSFLKGKADYPYSLDWQKKMIADSQSYADEILVSTADLLKVIPKASYFPVMIDLNSFLMELSKQKFNKRTDKITILHAPSNVKMKGSTIIHKVLKEIAREHEDIEIVLTHELKRKTNSVYTVSRYELFKLYQESDIVVDQLVIGWYGLQSIEAILSKNATICYIEADLTQYLQPNCPIINANAINLKEVLLNTIEKIRKKEIDFNDQVEWVKGYHTLENQKQHLLNIWK